MSLSLTVLFNLKSTGVGTNYALLAANSKVVLRGKTLCIGAKTENKKNLKNGSSTKLNID